MTWNENVEREQDNEPGSEDECRRIDGHKVWAGESLVRNGRTRMVLGPRDESPNEEKSVEREPADKR